MPSEWYISDTFRKEWMDEFRRVCDETWRLTTYTAPTAWLTFRRLWNWKNK